MGKNRFILYYFLLGIIAFACMIGAAALLIRVVGMDPYSMEVAGLVTCVGVVVFLTKKHFFRYMERIFG